MAEDLRDVLRKVWPEWQLEEPLGTGAFGIVFRAVREGPGGRTYSAIKITRIPHDSSQVESLRSEGLGQREMYAYYQGLVQDLTKEIRMMGSVKGYANIVGIEDYKIYHPDNQMIWYILIRMELLQSLPLHLSRNGISEPEIIRLGADLCNALEGCRERNIVHRDIKPDNIFIDRNGRFKLGDFGVAKNLERMTNGLSRKGTPYYMAPEIYRGTLQEADFNSAAKVDIYSLGLVLYWLSNGSRLPFVSSGSITSPGEKNTATVRRISGEPLPPPAQASAGLQRIILKACAFRPEDRYATAAEMREELLKLQPGNSRGEQVPARGNTPAQQPEAGRTPPPPEEKKDKKNRKLLALPIALVLLGVVVLGIVLLRQGGDGKPSATATPMVTATPTAEPTATPTAEPTATPTAEPTATPTAEPTATPTPEPTATPTPEPTATPTPEPTATPTPEPTATPTPEPTATPTAEPTATPTAEPAESGSTESRVSEMNQAYQDGEYGKALICALMLASEGNPDGQYMAGLMYFKGEGTQQDYEKAVRFYRQSAEQGNRSALNNLGYMYSHGLGVEESAEMALYYYKAAAEKGNVLAMFNAGLMYEKGRGTPQSFEDAARYYRMAADQGNADAQESLGTLYFNGLGVEKSHETALQYYLLAADQGNKLAQKSAADMYYDGDGTEQNYELAMKYYLLAADQGDTDSQNTIGIMYYNGFGVPQSNETAALWFRTAADGGHATAQSNLGYLYKTGKGVTQSYERAAEYYQLAADQGHSGAQLNLGMFYEDGLGVQVSFEKAAEYYWMASQNGRSEGMEHLRDLYNKGRITLEQLQKLPGWDDSSL